uniref:Secreted protein n=1 Tax=Haemonchus contortus TaxID=6289 RepID=A0A7I5EDK2_HAECO
MRWLTFVMLLVYVMAVPAMLLLDPKPRSPRSSDMGTPPPTPPQLTPHPGFEFAEPL